MKVILISSEDKPAPSTERVLKKHIRKPVCKNTENLRKLVVDAAAAILQEEGPEAVTVRRVSQRMGCSTKIIYSLFVNKEGLAQQLYLEGCKLLAQRFEEVPPSPDLLRHLLDLGEAFWQFGQDYTSYYKLMFGGAFCRVQAGCGEYAGDDDRHTPPAGSNQHCPGARTDLGSGRDRDPRQHHMGIAARCNPPVYGRVPG
ncbi:TetR/AcrR family transcriptional regulator [Paenibacillus rhizoplanae]